MKSIYLIFKKGFYPLFLNKKKRSLAVSIYIAFSLFGFGQTPFIFTEDGLSPDSLVREVKGSSVDSLKQKALDWVNTSLSKDNVVFALNHDNTIELTGISYDVITADKQSYHVKYTIKLSFKNGLYQFQPVSLQTKMNSKYDMGWKDFSLKDGSTFFRRGKVIKKLKSYVEAIPLLLNTINANLYNHLTQ